mmetsp:Transcript_49499/g.153688  ORF Transcript_49499/g.153688 Transcript_49499/m.153688 type:complete len:235 (+) Transcript_49499:552-1256(+)
MESTEFLSVSRRSASCWNWLSRICSASACLTLCFSCVSLRRCTERLLCFRASDFARSASSERALAASSEAARFARSFEMILLARSTSPTCRARATAAASEVSLCASRVARMPSSEKCCSCSSAASRVRSASSRRRQALLTSCSSTPRREVSSSLPAAASLCSSRSFRSWLSSASFALSTAATFAAWSCCRRSRSLAFPKSERAGPKSRLLRKVLSTPPGRRTPGGSGGLPLPGP